MNRLFALSIQVALCLAAWVTNLYYPSVYVEKAFYTFLSLAIIYLISKVIIEENLVKRIKDSKTKYSARKVVSVIYILVFILIVTSIWVEDTQAILVTFGLVGAGIAISLQDLFKNFVGGMMIFFTGIYRVGDRIETASKHGDVIDIGILYTTLLEIREWVDGDQATGRLSIMPNGVILSSVVNNYTKDHNFIWDEITLPITYDSDWKKASNLFAAIVEGETKDVVVPAEAELEKIMQKYYLSKRMVAPSIFITLTSNWIEFHVRYITDFRERRILRTKILQRILDEVEKSENIKIASETLDISHSPDSKGL